MSSSVSFKTASSLPQPKSSRGACGPCHKTKAKCTFEPGCRQCARCCTVGRQCLPRKKKRMGRRPAADLFPHGCAILELDADGDNPCIRGEPVNPHSSLPKPELTDLANLSETLTWNAQNIEMLKPSIFWDAFDLAGMAFGSPHIHTPDPPIQAYPELGQMLDTKEGFFSAHRKFMLGQCFVEEFQYAVRSVFARAPQTLGLAYSTCLHILNYRQVRPRGLEGIDVKYGSQCLDLLMRSSSCVRNVEDAAVVIMMGQVLLVYNMLLSGPSSRTITQGVLLAVKDWYPALIQQPHLDSITLTPILIDTVDCLVRRQRPMVRLPNVDRLILDRILGLCSSLLPLLFDLCEQSYQVKTNGLDGVSRYPEFDPYTEIEKKIRSWAPPISPGLFTKCQGSEIAAILAQARSYRITCLLVIHRLRFPLGIEDAVGEEYANIILNELSFMTRWPTNGPTGFGLDFPLLVAMMEMPGSGGDLFRAFGPLRFQPHISNHMIDLVAFVRKAYNDGYDGLWFDLVEKSTMDILIP